MENIIALVSTVFAFCCKSQEYNITFHANKTTWNEAVVHCANIGGAIYSDEFDIRKRYEDELNNTDEVWTGKYQAFSPWRITWGCYRINVGDTSKDMFSVSYGDQPECQKKCSGTDFFAVKGDICKCLHTTEVNEERKANINPCNCSTCVTVLRHRIDNVRTRDATCTSKNTDCICMAATCIDNKLTLTPEHCALFYGVLCELPVPYSHLYNDSNSSTYRNQIAATQFCYNQNSILRWYTSHEDICQLGATNYWTSGRRSVHQYIKQYRDEVSNLNPLRCLSVNRENEQGPDYVECTNLLPFFCKTGGNIHEEDDLLNADGHGHSKAGLIIGIVVSITVVAFITVVILVFRFFRIHSTKHLPDSTGGSAGCTANDNTAMSNYEQLDNTAEDKNIKAYDRLNVAHIPGQFNVQFQTITSREDDDLSNTKDIHAFDYTTTSEYVQLDTSDKAKSTNVYDQLHAVHAVVTGQVIGHSTTIIAKEEHQNYESTENTNNIDNHTASSEYEQLDNEKQANSTHVYDQLDVAHEVNKDPTNNHLTYTNI